METGEHGAGVRDGKPTIRNALEDYAGAFLKWLGKTLKD